MDHPSLFDVPAEPVPVVMCLDAEWYDLMWRGEKTHEFRRRFLTEKPVRWFVYLTAPESQLCAVIDLDPAIEDTPEQIAQIAERTRPGNGATVEPYLARGDRTVGYAMPIRRVREYHGFSARELTELLGEFHPPQGYLLVDRHPAWRSICDRLMATPVIRETAIEPLPVA
ncbi:hypothetical protein GCM10027059_43350 [Myceligenerans halotolerans]